MTAYVRKTPDSEAVLADSDAGKKITTTTPATAGNKKKTAKPSKPTTKKETK